MNDFQNIMYDLILDSLTNYVESGELDIYEAEVLSEAAYDEFFESRRMDREVGKYYNPKTKRYEYPADRPEWTKRYDLEDMAYSHRIHGDKKNRKNIHETREFWDMIHNVPNANNAKSRVIKKFNEKHKKERDEYFDRYVKGGHPLTMQSLKNGTKILVDGAIGKRERGEKPIFTKDYNKQVQAEMKKAKQDKLRSNIKNKLDIRKKIPAFLPGIMN